MAKLQDGGEGWRRRSRRARVSQPRKGVNSAGKGGMPRWLIFLAGLGALGFTVCAVAAIAGVIVYRDYADQLVAPDELAINKPSYGAEIMDRNGKLLYEYLDDQSGLRRPIKLSEVSPAFLAATIATEDSSFFTNPGINIQGLGRAAWQNLSPLADTPGFLTGGGGSSITQQLVKNVYIPQAERQKRSPSRKIKETVFAIELTNRYDKERILEWYVNQIGYGGVYNGVEAASEGYFGHPAKDLTLAEAALLAGIPQSPAAYDPVNHPEASAARRDEVLDLMTKKGRVQIGDDAFYDVNEEEVAAAREVDVAGQISVKRFPIQAPHFVLQYIQPQLEALFGRDALYRDGLVVTTTLDLDMQNQSQEIMEGWIREYEDVSNSRNGSVMVMEPKSGEILAMVGSRDYFRDDILGKNNNATACNSPGSSFKPFAYITAFLNLGWGPGTMILDTPVSYPQSDGTVFTPSNPTHNFSGPVTVRYALGNSLNIPADKTAAAVGPENVVAESKKFGFLRTFRTYDPDTPWPGGGCSAGGYGPAIATGGVGVTLEEMMIGYSVLANGGVMSGAQTLDPQARRANERQIDPVSILKVTDAEQQVRYDVETKRKEARVIAAEYPYLISSILSDSQAQCATFGCGGISIPGIQAGVKTGTSEPFTSTGPNAGKIGETWAFAYTPDYVVGIWAGNADNSPVVNIFSTSISFRTVRDVLKQVYQDTGQAATRFARPANIVDGTVCVPSGLKPTPLCAKTTSDIFVKDKLPTQDDNWWQQVRLDVRNGLLAGPATPPQYVQTQVMLVPPPELLKTEEDKKSAQEWAAALGLPLAPTEASNGSVGPGGVQGDVPALIFSPSAGSNASGVVTVMGRASSPGFLGYRLEFGAGASPTGWTQIFQSTLPVDSGPIGVWNTSGLANGVYTLRLTVTDRTRGQVTSTVTVQVGPGGPGITPTAPAVPTTTAPPLQP